MSDLGEAWEARYAESDRIWTGNVNLVVAQVAAELSPGRALDLGCGEGGDAIWLAQRGWRVLGVDVSTTALDRARSAAQARGISATDARFESGDLATWTTRERFDLVTASFLHSWPVAIPREEILRRATEFVAPGGRLLVVSHAETPPWAAARHEHEGEHGRHGDHAHLPMPSPQEDLAALDLDAAAWDVHACERRTRAATAPDGSPATLVDGVVLVQRRPS